MNWCWKMTKSWLKLISRISLIMLEPTIWTIWNQMWFMNCNELVLLWILQESAKLRVLEFLKDNCLQAIWMKPGPMNKLLKHLITLVRPRSLRAALGHIANWNRPETLENRKLFYETFRHEALKNEQRFRNERKPYAEKNWRTIGTEFALDIRELLVFMMTDVQQVGRRTEHRALTVVGMGTNTDLENAKLKTIQKVTPQKDQPERRKRGYFKCGDPGHRVADCSAASAEENSRPLRHWINLGKVPPRVVFKILAMPTYQSSWKVNRQILNTLIVSSLFCLTIA